MIRVIEMRRALLCKYRGLCGTVPMFMIEIKALRTSGYIFSVKRVCGPYNLTHDSGRVTQICVFNTVKLGTFASSP